MNSNNNYIYTRALLGLSIALSVMPVAKVRGVHQFALSPRRIIEIKKQLKDEESRVANLRKIALVAGAGAITGAGYYGYKWLAGSPQQQGLSTEQLNFLSRNWQRLQTLLTSRQNQAADGQAQVEAQSQPAAGQAGQVPAEALRNNQNNNNQSGAKMWWLYVELMSLMQTCKHFAKHEVAYRLYSSTLNKLNDLYVDRNLEWFIQQRTILQATLDNFKQELVMYNARSTDSKNQLENAFRCVLAELEMVLGFIVYTIERAQIQLQSQNLSVSVYKLYLRRLELSKIKIQTLITNLGEQVALLLSYDENYDQQRSVMHNTVAGSLIKDLTTEIDMIKQFEKKLNFQNQIV